MSNLDELIHKYLIKPCEKLNRICSPLSTFLNIPIFGYTLIESNGHYCNLSNAPDILECYYANHFHLIHPYLRHPHLFRSGYTIIPLCWDDYSKDLIKKYYQINHQFLIQRRNKDRIEGFYFAIKKSNYSNKTVHILNQIDLLYKFIHYFEREAEGLIGQCFAEQYNLKTILGKNFYKTDQSVPLLDFNAGEEAFLKTVSPLSKQEQRCLDYFKQGYSAQATAACMGLSKRTIEHYFDNMKKKLGYYSKWQLLKM